MDNKEKVYDEQISPLIKKVIAICKEHGMSMFTEFQFSDSGFCRSRIPNSEHAIFDIYMAMSQCKEEGNVNIDKFLFWMCKQYDNSMSVFLHDKVKRKANEQE